MDWSVFKDPEYKEHVRKKRAAYVFSKTENHKKKLSDLGFIVTVNFDNAHIAIKTEKEIIDYWATTESFFFRKRKIKGKGYRKLLVEIKEGGLR